MPRKDTEEYKQYMREYMRQKRAAKAGTRSTVITNTVLRTNGLTNNVITVNPNEETQGMLQRNSAGTNYVWSGRRDSNSRLSAWEADILPLNYSRLSYFHFT